MSLSNDPCMFRPTLIDLNFIELHYYPFMISLDKCKGSYDDVDGSSMKIYVPNKTLVKHISCRGFSKHLSYHCFCVPNWVCKRPKAFSHAEDMKKSAGALQSTASPPVGPGQSPDGGPRGKAPGSSAYLGFENLLL